MNKKPRLTVEDQFWIESIKESSLESCGKYLFFAIEDNDLWRVHFLLDFNSKRDLSQNEELIWSNWCRMGERKAIEKGNLKALKLIIEYYPSFIKDERYEGIFDAVREGHKDIVEYLLSKGAEENDAMIMACIYNKTEIVQLFLDKEYISKEKAEETLLRLSNYHGHGDDVAKFLLKDSQDGLLEKARDVVFALEDYIDKKRREDETYPPQAEKIKDFDLNKLRKFKNEDSENGLMVLTIVGKFNLLAKKSKSEPHNKISFNDLTKKNALGHNLLEILGKRKELNQAFDPELWAGRTHEMKRTWKQVSKEYHDQVDFKKALYKANRSGLHKYGRKR